MNVRTYRGRKVHRASVVASFPTCRALSTHCGLDGTIYHSVYLDFPNRVSETEEPVDCKTCLEWIEIQGGTP